MWTRRELITAASLASATARAANNKTEVSIDGDRFLINGKPTYAGRMFEGRRIEGLLMNTRMVQASFDDLNPATRNRWAYKDTGKWDAARNNREFLAAMPLWRKHGILAFTVNLQGGSPEGYSKQQPWENNAFDPDGSLRPAYLQRMARVIDRADKLGMVVILGYFYFGQDERLRDEKAVRNAVANATRWVLDRGDRNVLIEVNNECDVRYDHAILKPEGVHELIEQVKSMKDAKGRRLLVSTSYGGGKPARANVIRAADFLLLHGNGPDDPSRIRRMIETTRATDGYRKVPVLINEDDHFRFSDRENHLMTALDLYVSWGYFDPQGYQSPPVNWGIDTERKQQFFSRLKTITGA